MEHFVKTGSANEKRQGRNVVPLVLQKIQPSVHQVCVCLSAVTLLELVRFLRFHLFDAFLYEKTIFNKNSKSWILLGKRKKESSCNCYWP